MKQLFKTTTVPQVVIILETAEEQAAFGEFQDNYEEMLWWLDMMANRGLLDDDYNPNKITWQAEMNDDAIHYNLFYDDTGEMVKLVVQKSKEVM